MSTLTMDNRQQTLEEFFTRYENRFNEVLSGGQPDVEDIAGDFAEYFIEASPVGIISGANDKKFREMIPEGWGFYKKIGVQAMNILSKDITMLDEMHAVVKIQWKSLFIRKDESKGDIVFEVFYMVQLRKDGPKIFAYVTGDEQKALKEEGLI
jgi:hypothetical protein